MTDAFADLATFARTELTSRDLEPWADLLAELHHSGDIDTDAAYWLVKLYNGYDDLGSAWSVYRRWPSPNAWLLADDYHDAASYPCTQERRGMRAGKIIRHLVSYHANLAGATQETWAKAAAPGDHLTSLSYLSKVWGVGRQTAFEWAEFLAKVCELPLTCDRAEDVMLWESEGPRRSLERLYNDGNRAQERGSLNLWATELHDWLANDAGVALTWEDFETVICDFNVMRDGRYYPGKHLAALREEIATVPDADRPVLEAAFQRIIPADWASIAPGIDRDAQRIYRDTGRILTGAMA